MTRFVVSENYLARQLSLASLAAFLLFVIRKYSGLTSLSSTILGTLHYCCYGSSGFICSLYCVGNVEVFLFVTAEMI